MLLQSILNIVYQQVQQKMQGKYHDIRVYQHFVHTHSRVPYLDYEIHNIQNSALRESRRANQRAQLAQQGLDRTKQKSELLSNAIKDSRLKKEQEAQQFLATLQKSQEACLEKEKLAWSNYEKEQEQGRLQHIKDQLYLQSLLKSTSTKAQSRLASVRRWN